MHAPAVSLAPEGSMERRVIDAADSCVSRWGWRKTTMADIGDDAGLSRASVYRAFPGGRDAIYDALRRHRQVAFFHELLPTLDEADDLLTLLTDSMVAAARLLRDDEHFQYQLANEPGPLLRELTFDGLDRTLALARVFVAPHVGRFVERREAARLTEWATRIIISYTLEPSDYLDITDSESVRTFVSSRALPGIVGDAIAHPVLSA